MNKKPTVPGFVDRVGRRHPRLMGLVVAGLTVFIVVVEIMSTDAPLVLYQAF